MKKLFQNWGLITKDEENKSEIKSTEIPVIPITANVIVSTEDNSVYTDLINKALEQRNVPGPDFLEFYKTLKSNLIQGQPVSEQQKYILAFSGLSMMGLTKDKILETSNVYLETIEKEKNNFVEALKQYEKTEISDKEQKRLKLIKDNQELLKKTEENNKTIQSLTMEILDNTNNLQKKQKSFDNTVLVEKNSILTIINNIKNYL